MGTAAPGTVPPQPTMKPALPLSLLCVCLAAFPAFSEETDGFEALPQPSGQSAPPVSAGLLLAECREQMPAEPIRLRGWVRHLRPRGFIDGEFLFDATLRLGGETPTIQYTFSEKDGAISARATIRRLDGGSELILETGPALEPAETPPWTERILGTDVTWLDVSMDFLTWTNAELAGESTIRGRLCDLVEIYPPEPIPGCRKVRLWVDREIRMFLQVQQVDEERRVARQMRVRSVKKMGDRWMVQDLEVEGRNSGHRTRLHVLSCEEE